MDSNRHSGTPDRRAGGNPAYADWITVKFTDVLDVQGGTQPPKSQFIDVPKEGYIRLLQIRDFGAKPVPTYIPDTSKLKKCEEDDLLIGRYGASLGRICSGMVGAYNVALAKVLSVESLHKPFLKSYLESELFQQPLALLSRSAQNGFNKDDLATFDFVLPPLAEQKVIAEKLDTLLAQVDTTKARLERIPDIIKRFRQSVLAAAVSGKLTEEWRMTNSCEEALSLIEETSIGNRSKKELEIINKPLGNEEILLDIPESWAWTRLSRITEIASGVAKGGKGSGEQISLPYLRVANVQRGYLDLEEIKNITVSKDKAEKLYLKFGDVLFNEGGDLDKLGRGWIWEEQIENCIHQNHVFRARVCSSLFEPKFISYYGNSEGKEYFYRNGTQSVNLASINKTVLSLLPVPVPPAKEQTEIVRRVEELFAFADTIELKAAAALERVNNLTQSILAKAFRGELTADWRAANPELISGDNSAEALLVKIQAEREALKPVKKTRKKKAKA